MHRHSLAADVLLLMFSAQVQSFQLSYSPSYKNSCTENVLTSISPRKVAIVPRCLRIRSSLDFVKVYAGQNKRQQMLPVSLVSSFGKWIVNDDRLNPILNDDPGGLEDGWVDPISFDEVWLPVDLPRPLQRPAIAALIKDGAIRYLMPALDISVQAGGKLWWNRGMCSFPFARAWMDVAGADLQKLTLTAWSQRGYVDATKLIREIGDEIDEMQTPSDEWTKLWQTGAKEAMLKLVETLAEAALTEAPEAGTRLRLFLSDSNPTSEAASSAEVAAMTAAAEGSAELDVLYRAVSAGGESQHLPSVYRELYRSPP